MSIKIEKQETKRLILQPLDLGDKYTENEKASMTQEERFLATSWNIFLKEGNVLIGSMHLSSPVAFCTVKSAVEIREEYRNTHYGSEAFGALLGLVFTISDVFFVEAEITGDNIAAIKMLEKLYFVRSDSNNGSLLFVREKPVVMWAPIYILLGLMIGLGLGFVLRRFGLCILCGLGTGILFGFLTDIYNHGKRKAARKIREEGTKK